jgi:hypothetical protein
MPPQTHTHTQENPSGTDQFDSVPLEDDEIVFDPWDFDPNADECPPGNAVGQTK